MADKRRVFAYTRLSLDKDGQQTATARQLADIKRLCEYRDWELVKVYEDVDLSASKASVRRPAYEQMLDDLDAGLADGVVVWKFDRLMRRPAEFERFWTHCEPAGGLLVSVTEGFDTSSPIMLALVRILIIFAGMEAESMAIRMRRKIEENAASGKHHGPPPYGYRLVGRHQLEVDDAQASVIRDAAQRVLHGESVWSVVRDLNAGGIPTPTGRGGVWRQASLNKALRNPVVAGFRSYKGEVIGSGDWEPILDEPMWRNVTAVLEARADPHRGKDRQHKHALPSILRCGRCGNRLVSWGASSGRRQYTCLTRIGGCGRLAVEAEHVDREVRNLIVVARSQPTAVAAIKGIEQEDSRLREITERLATTRSRLAELGMAYRDGKFKNIDGYLVANAALESDIERLEKEHRRLLEGSVLASLPTDRAALQAHWDGASVHERRRILHALFAAIEILPPPTRRPRFDPSRIRPLWHDGASESRDLARR